MELVNDVTTPWQQGAAAPATTVPRPSRAAPPAWDAQRCAAGVAGIPGCQRCADACPYGAIRGKARPGGLAIEIDPEACRRCGACTSVCPTDALTRSFADDREVDAAVRAALDTAPPGAIAVLTCPDSAATAQAAAPDAAVVALPSLLLLDETHLLGALRAGASGVALVACEDCDHDAPEPLRQAATLARAATDDHRVALIADEAAQHTATAVAAFAAAHADSGALPRARTASRRRRTRLHDLLATDLVLTDLDDTALPFGEVAVSEPDCTLCGACARLCPTDALAYDPTAATLTFDAGACVGCGLCAAGCPQEAVTLAAGVRGDALRAGRHTVVEDTAVHCRHCEAPFTPQRLLDHAWHTLTDQSGPTRAAQADLDVCGACKERGGGTGRAGAHATARADAPDGADPPPAGGVSRRGFLKRAATSAAGASLLPLMGSGAPAQAETGQQQHWAMVIDLERCIGCHACTNVCKAENNVPIGGFRDWVEEHEMGEYPNARAEFLPKLCNQCDDPGCLRVCPTGSIYRRESDNIIELDPDICIACQACMQGCPYGMTFYNSARRTADKCNYCAHRLDAGMRPACVDICPSQCRIFGDRNDPDSWVSQALADRESIGIREELGMGPNTTYFALPGHLNA